MKYVKPEISEQKAQNILSRKISSFAVRITKRHVSLKRIELIYLPYYLFDILLTGKKGIQKITVSVDGLLGNTMFFTRESLNYVAEVNNPVCDFVLSSTEAQKIATEEYKWQLLEHGLRNRKALSLEDVSQTEIIFYPFWVGYYQKGRYLDFKAVDGISGEVQGIKMRKVFLKALREMV